MLPKKRMLANKANETVYVSSFRLLKQQEFARIGIDRMYDQNKWFIGLIFTIALSVLGMSASNFFNKKDT